MTPVSRLPMALAAAAATAATFVAVTAPGPAAAAIRCAPATRSALAPHLTSPCDGAAVRRRHSVVFTAIDPDREASAHAPYIDLTTTRTLVDGHLALDRDGNGVLAQMTPVPGHPREWTYTAGRQGYPSWWDNRAGTDYVQVEQVDPRAPSGIVYGPITTVRVP